MCFVLGISHWFLGGVLYGVEVIGSLTLFLSVLVLLNFDLKVSSFLVNAYNNSGVKSGCTN